MCVVLIKMDSFLIQQIQITNTSIAKQPSAPTPLCLSIQKTETALPHPVLDQEILFNLNTRSKYQRLPVRRIYEEISVLDSFDDSENCDIPPLFKAKKEVPKLCVPIKGSLFELKGKSNLPLASKRQNKNARKSKKRNSHPGNPKSVHTKAHKNSFCFLNAERLKGLLEHNGNRKKLVQGDFVGNGAKKETQSKHNYKATDVLGNCESNRVNPKYAEHASSNAKDATKSWHGDLVDKIISKSTAQTKKSRAGDTLLETLSKYMSK
eukprot:TRINITY_DN14494_c0_g1_i1.p1 TRINITY_DN14494_c0_g1~~TRINITY_DN14494_c0_g1_i1.p1  ORF type:complete len:265 (+),score=43.30 TRINITY_DN14494_c0_g1_i1:153-947(+)